MNALKNKVQNQKGERVEETIWHNLVVWDKTPENLAKFTDKGSEIAVEGKLTNRSYTDKNGDKKLVTEIVVNEFLLLDKKPKEQ